MIFNLSYNWLKEYLPKAPPPKELARLLSLHSVSVERWHELGENLENIVVGEVVKIERHPQADRLWVVEVRIGEIPRLRPSGSARDDRERTVKIVCGGSNLFVGQKVAVALPGAQVRWHGEGELVELKPAKIRGVESAGMICAAEEIGLGESFPKTAENEILDLSNLAAKAGTPVAQALGLDDTVLEVEATTNRPDLLSVLGVAREAAAILGQKFNIRRLNLRYSEVEPPKIAVTVEDKKLCPRYQAVAVYGVKVQPSPAWLRQRLMAAGLRSINNVVDVTNYVMLEMGQPLHAFDYDKLTAAQDTRGTLVVTRVPLVSLMVRRARSGEKLKALDGKEYVLTPEMLVIADSQKPLAVAGVMGGEESGVGEATSTIILESANFDPVSVRRTARALNLYSQSQALFEKGLPPEGTAPALQRALELLRQIGGEPVQVSAVTDIWPVKPKSKVFKLTAAEAEKYIGVKIPAPRVKKILTSLGFRVSGGATLKVSPPYWRSLDIETSRDLIEEIARLYGYHNLPATLPEGRLPVAAPDRDLAWETKLKNDLAGFGMTEVFTYSFISVDLLTKAGWDIEQAKELVRLSNPLSEEFEYMRPCLVPGALAAVAGNQENFPAGAIFEISKVYRWAKAGELPAEETMVAVTVWGEETEGGPFFKAKGILESLFDKYRVDGNFVRAKSDVSFHPGRSVEILIKGESVGPLHEIHPAILESLKINKRVAIFEFPLKKFMKAASFVGVFEPLPLFPAVKRDLAVAVDHQTAYADLTSAIKQVDPLIARVDLFDVYIGKGIPEGKKSLALHILYQSGERTLSDAEVSAIHEKVAKKLEQKFSAVIR